MKTSIIYYILLFSNIYNSLENTIKYLNKFGKKNNNKKVSFNNKDYWKKDLNFLSKKEERNILANINEEKIIKEIDLIIKNITKNYENEIFNLSEKINYIINSTLDTQNATNQREESEKKEIDNLLTEINLLKENYKKNMNYTYILCGIIFIIFIFFFILDLLKKGSQQVPAFSGYEKAIDSKNTNNQLSIV